MKFENVTKFINEINDLKNRAALLDEIMSYYDRETMTFVVPEKWGSLKMLVPEKLKQLPASPRHSLMLKIHATLPFSEVERKINWDRLDEKLAQSAENQ